MDARDESGYAALAAKIDELSQVCARLSRENTELRDRVSRLTAGTSSVAGHAEASARRRPGRRDEAADGKFSRRGLGKALGVAAAGAVGAAALVDATARPAVAVNGDAITAGQFTTAETATHLRYDGNGPVDIFVAIDASVPNNAEPAALAGLAGTNTDIGVYGSSRANGGDGVKGVLAPGTGGGTGVRGAVSDAGAIAVLAENGAATGDAIAVMGTVFSASPGSGSAAVRGENRGTGGEGIGVWGSHAGSGWGVYGAVPNGVGVVGASTSGTSGAGVLASGAIGVDAFGKTAVIANGSAVGLQAQAPTAVRAAGTGKAGVGVSASGSGAGGRGGVFAGPAAQVRLSPGPLATHPRSGSRGDLYADAKGRLWFCKTGGSTASWHQIA
jgi:hypothetical protein